MARNKNDPTGARPKQKRTSREPTSDEANSSTSPMNVSSQSEIPLVRSERPNTRSHAASHSGAFLSNHEPLEKAETKNNNTLYVDFTS